MIASSPRPAGSDVCRCGHRRDQHRYFPGLGIACAVTGLREDEWADACWRFEPQPEDVTIDLPPNPTQRRIPIPAAPDTTGGELREAIALAAHHALGQHGDCPCSQRGRLDCADVADAVLTLPALRDLLAERDTLAAQVQAAEAEIAARPNAEFDPIASYNAFHAIRRALGTPTTEAGQ